MASAPRSADSGRASIEAEVVKLEGEIKAAVGKVLSGVLLDEEAAPYTQRALREGAWLGEGAVGGKGAGRHRLAVRADPTAATRFNGDAPS